VSRANRYPGAALHARKQESELVGDFEADTQVEGSSGHYRICLSSEWEIWGPNGGYLAAIALRAMGREAAIPRPVSFHCHFLGVARFEAVDLRVSAIQQGKRAESFHVVMTQEGRPILSGSLRTAVAGPGLVHDVTRAPDVLPPEQLRTWEQLFPDEGSGPAFWKNIEGCPCEPDAVLKPGPHAPTLRQWNRYRPRATFADPFVDAARQLVLIDTLAWPAGQRPHVDPAFQAPNLDVGAWFHRGAPQEEWLLAEQECSIAEGGLLGARSRVWSRDGRLLASGGAQLFCIPAR
jgi:acyl-CoA thioesterase II